jgi:Protein of unknown function (DUF3037)
MSAIPYTYSIVRYVHDPAAGETLNIGVVLHAPSRRYVAARLEHRYERLSNAFAGFDGDHYRKTIRQFEAAVKQMQERWESGLPEMWDLPADVGGVVAAIWPDTGLSFQAGPVLAGLARNLDETLAAIFERMVSSQGERPRWEKRSDEDVWSVYQRSLAREQVQRVLRPKILQTADFKHEFKHAFKNDRWHVLQPVSLDYVRAETIQRTVARWLGSAVALAGHPELGKLYLLLGPPQLDEHRESYAHAKKLLHKMPVDHELVEEEQAEQFARRLAAYLREHGVIDDTPGDE